jgi:hypothetical protein
MGDHGANVTGSNMCIIFCHPTWSVHIKGYDQHCTTSIPNVTYANVVHTQRSEVMAIYHNYACTGKGCSIHSVPQLEAYKQLVDESSLPVGSLQCITTHDGYILPIDIINALPYIKSRPCSDDNFENTADSDWDLSSLDFQHDAATFSDNYDGGTMLDSRFHEHGD